MRFRPRHDTEAGSARSAAFETGALSYINALYWTALRLSGNRADAEDLVQETCLKAFRSAAQFEPGTNLKAWLFTILHNTFLNTRRRAGRETIGVEADDLEQAPQAETAESPEDILLRQTLDADLQEAYGWRLKVPDGSPALKLHLVGGRRCFSTDGRVAHILYRHDGRLLSLFFVPGSAGRAVAALGVLGHEAVLWSQGGMTVVVKRASRANSLRARRRT